MSIQAGRDVDKSTARPSRAAREFASRPAARVPEALVRGRVARAYGAVSTPHAFVLDRDRRLLYRGRIDDSRDPSKVTSFDLDRALPDVLETGR